MIITLLIRLPRGPIERLPFSYGIGLLIVMALAVLLLLWSRRNKTRYWDRGIFPPHYTFNRDHLMEAYIAAAGALFHRDPRSAGKLTFLDGFFQWEFPDVHYDFRDSYLQSVRCAVTVESLASWLNKHLNEAEKLKLIAFLEEFALVDGEMTEAESRMLLRLKEFLRLT